MTYALSDMLRYSISNNEHMVTISDEITHIKNYFVIQNIRFNNEIDISYDISPDVLYKKTIRFVLQPIAENSIYHGFDNVQKDKRIKITAQTKDGHTFLQIEDNGKGITESTLKGLKKQLFSLDESNQFFHCKGINSKSNIGIHNVPPPYPPDLRKTLWTGNRKPVWIWNCCHYSYAVTVRQLVIYTRFFITPLTI